MPPDERVASPAGTRWVVLAALVALAAVPAAYLLLRPAPREEPGVPRGPYLAARPLGGMQVGHADDGEYGTLIPLDALVPDVTVGTVTPLDATGAEVPHALAAIEIGDTVAQSVLYGAARPRVGPLPVRPGDELRLVLLLRPDCPDAAPVTAVRVTLTVRGQPAEQVVAFTPEQRATHADRTRAICAGG